jgi:ABC-type nitrate/sulfonate/bicarbonate transport system substrate-binding protein
MMAVSKTSRQLFITLLTLFLTCQCGAETTTNECQSSNEKDGVCINETLQKVRIGLEWFVNPDHLPLIVAKRHGIFEEFGLDVELVEPETHWEAEEEILADRLDVAVTEPLHLAQDAAKGKPVLGFSRFFHTDGGVMFDKSKSGIERPRDMCGKTISYPGSPGPGGPAIVNTMVKADGKLDCDLQSYGKYNGGFFHTDAIESGKADVATLIFWNFEIPEAVERGMKDVSFFSLKDWGVPDFCQLVLMTTPARFEEMKVTFRKLVLAMRRSTGIIHQQPDLARKYYNEHVGKDDVDETQRAVMEATITATLPAFPNDNSMSSDYYDRLIGWLVETDQVDAAAASTVPVNSYWTNEVAW